MRFLLAAIIFSIGLLACSKKTSAPLVSSSPDRYPVKKEVQPPAQQIEPTPNDSSVIKEIPHEEAISSSEPYLIASLAKTPCYGRCPVFEVRIFSVGLVVFVGRYIVYLIGKYQARADQAFVNQIQSLARSVDYLSFESLYPKQGKKILDLPNTITYIKLDGKEKSVTNNHHAPKELLNFEKKVEALINGLYYQKVK